MTPDRILLIRLLLWVYDQRTTMGHLSVRQTTESRGRCLPRYVDGVRVVAVEYRRLRSFGEYENETVGATAEVSTGNAPEGVLEALKTWVESNFGERANARDAASRVHQAEARLREVSGLLHEAEKRWAAAQKILAAAGVEVPKDWGAGDDGELERLPFL